MHKTLEELTTEAANTGFSLYWNYREQNSERLCSVDARTLQAIARSEIPINIGDEPKPLCELLSDWITTHSEGDDKAFLRRSDHNLQTAYQLKEFASPVLTDVIVSILNNKQAHWALRASCAGVLGVPGASEEVIAALIAVIKDEHTVVNDEDVSVLEVPGPFSEVIDEDFIAAGEEDDVTKIELEIGHSIGIFCAEALGKIGVSSQDVISDLLAGLQDKHEDVRAACAEALGKIGSSFPEVIQALLKGLQDEHYYVRSICATALGKIGVPYSEEITSRISELKNKDGLDRLYSAIKLAEIGISDLDVIAALLEGLKYREWNVFEWLEGERCVKLLGKIGINNTEVVTILIDALQHPFEYEEFEKKFRIECATALGEIGVFSPQVIAALLRGLKDGRWGVRSACAEALGKMSVSSPKVVSALLRGLKDESEFVRFRCVEALRAIGVFSPIVIKTFIARLKDESSNVRSECADALIKFGIRLFGSATDQVKVSVKKLTIKELVSGARP